MPAVSSSRSLVSLSCPWPLAPSSVWARSCCYRPRHSRLALALAPLVLIYPFAPPLPPVHLSPGITIPLSLSSSLRTLVFFCEHLPTPAPTTCPRPISSWLPDCASPERQVSHPAEASPPLGPRLGKDIITFPPRLVLQRWPFPSFYSFFPPCLHAAALALVCPIAISIVAYPRLLPWYRTDSPALPVTHTPGVPPRKPYLIDCAAKLTRFPP